METKAALLAACEVLGIDPERTTSLRLELDVTDRKAGAQVGPRLVAHWEGQLRLTPRETARVLEALDPVYLPRADGD